MGKNSKINDDIFGPYDYKIHRIGRLTTALALILMFLPVAGIVLRYDVKIVWSQVAIAITTVLSFSLASGIVEPLTFAPVLGAGATYMAFTTGSVSQVKVPCVVNSQEILGVEAGTKEGDVVATLAVGVSTFVTTLMLAIAMALLTVIYPILSHPIVSPGVNNIMAALFGALGVMILMKDIRTAAMPYLVCAALYLIMGASNFNSYALWIMIGLVLFSIVWAYILFKKDQKKNEQ